MSRGLGHIQRMILASIEPDGAWMIGHLCERVYPGINRIEKKHRVAVLRAIRKMKLPGTFCLGMIWGGGYCLCDECSLVSAARRDWFNYCCHVFTRRNRDGDRSEEAFAKFMESRKDQYEPSAKFNTFAGVERAKRWHFGSEIDRIDVQIERAETRMMFCRPEVSGKYQEEICSLRARREELSGSAA